MAKLNVKLLHDYKDTVSKSTLQCLTCKTIFERVIAHFFNNDAKCHICFPPWGNKVSKWHQEIVDFIASLGIYVEVNNRSIINPLELDIYVPSHNFAIECNGLYWHSESPNIFSSNTPETKRIQAIQKNIDLMTIFEDEWRNKSDIIKSMILHRLKQSTKIGARKLTLTQCNQKDVRHLLDEWHLEGHVNSSFALKLSDNFGNIIGVCTLRWARGKQRKILEIARLAFKPTIHVTGGISKFVTTALKLARVEGAHYLMSYSDNRLGRGTGYAFAGMKLEKITTQRFWWTDFKKRYNRLKYRADKTNHKSEKQVANEAGVFRIYACSNSCWIYDLTQHKHSLENHIFCQK